jgi:hypothetical protein
MMKSSMTKSSMFLLLSATAGALVTAPAAGQVTLTPMVGVHVPASDLEGLREQAEQSRVERGGTMALGLAVELGWLRGSIAYATGATLTEKGVQGGEDIGEGSVLAAAADIVWRPLPRLLVQPYLLGGAGVKREDYSWNQSGTSDVFPADRSEFALHFGVAADVMLGRLGIMAEVTDFLGRQPDGGFAQHDAFVFVGLRVRM